jgi:predicted dehydrogenase/NADPH:quinone reductase-like Zn-dependent oxidoreductase
MRYEFLDERAQKAKKFAQPFLDEQAVLVAVQYMFFASHEELASTLAEHSGDPMSLPHKIKTVLERSMRMQCTELHTEHKIQKQPYSFSGHVIAVGAKVSTLRPGDAIACLGVGGSVNADLACISEYDAVLISDTAHIKEASITGFALLAMHAILRANLQVGQVVCVIGFSALGYLIMQLAKLSGTTVIVVDDNPIHIGHAKSTGAHYCYNSTEKGWQEEILYATQQHGVDVTFVVLSTVTGVTPEAAIMLTRAHGRIVLVGLDDLHIDHAIIGKKDIDFAVAALHEACHHGELYRQHNTIVPFVKWRQRGAMQQILRLIEHEELQVNHLIRHHIESNGINTVPVPTDNLTMGIVVSFPTLDQFSLHTDTSEVTTKKSCESPKHVTRFIPATRDTVRIGIIGADIFVKDILMPLLSRMHNVTIRAIADVEQASAEHISHLYGVAKTCIMDSELLQGDGVDVVIVASNNMFHADRVIHALEHSKAVFVKEPLAATFEQLARLTTALNEHGDVPMCLDYYRSYAPFMRKIKHAVQKRSTPLMIRYRINTCTSLRCTEQEDAIVGKIVGDACHFLDVFCYLTDARPVAISVEAIHTMRDDIFPTDNFAAQISFSDGSVCSLVYTSLGHEHFGGEHLEIFFDAKAIVMQDFLTLHGYGLPSWFDEIVSVADSGREHLINDFFAGLREAPVRVSMSRERIITVAKLALILDQLACAGGGSHNIQEL